MARYTHCAMHSHSKLCNGMEKIHTHLQNYLCRTKNRSTQTLHYAYQCDRLTLLYLAVCLSLLQ